jgi:hypothetical protein
MSWITNDLADVKDGNGLRASTIFHLCVYAALIYCVVFLAKNYLNEAVLRARAEAKSESAKEIQEAAKAKESAAKKEIVIERESAHSDAELIGLLNRHVFTEVPLAPTPKLPDALPDAPSATLNRVQLEGLADYQASCRTCEVERESLKTQLSAEVEKSKAWERAAKGGSKWRRFGKAMKVIGCAAGGGALGSLSRQPAAGAAIGSASAAAVCSIF